MRAIPVPKSRGSPPSEVRANLKMMSNYTEKRFLPYTPEQLFNLVAAVDRYPEFLPWCIGARIRSREGLPGPHPRTLILSDLMIGFHLIRERYTSRVELDPPHRIDVSDIEGPFRHLKTCRAFERIGAGTERPIGGTMLVFHIEFEFRSKVLQSLIGVLFDEAVRRMVAAFETRAKQLYGPLASR